MAELKQSDVLKPKYPILSSSQFIEKYAKGVTIQAIIYNMKKGNIDYVVIGTERFVVMTPKTLKYEFNESSIRDAKPNKSTLKL